MIHWYKTSKKGFTLFEILLVITIMAIIAIAALTSTINTQRQFVFLNNFKEILNKVREARMYAVTQKGVELSPSDAVENIGIPSSYGVYIKNTGTQISITIFADLLTSTTQNSFDDSSSSNPDIVIGQPYFFDSSRYTFVALDEAAQEFTIDTENTLTLLYSPTEMKVVATGKDSIGTGHPFSGSYLYLTLTDTKGTPLSKKITVFLQSGIAEAIQDVTKILPAATP